MKKSPRERLLPKPEEISWERALRSVPVPNPAAEPQGPDEEGLTLVVQGRKPRFLVPPLSWILRPRLVRRVRLDRVGRDLWKLCDGTRNLEAVVDAFAAANRLTFHEARVAVTQYLAELTRRGVIAAAVTQTDG